MIKRLIKFLALCIGVLLSVPAHAMLSSMAYGMLAETCEVKSLSSEERDLFWGAENTLRNVYFVESNIDCVKEVPAPKALELIKCLLVKEGPLKKRLGIFCLTYLVWDGYGPAYDFAVQVASEYALRENDCLREEALKLFYQLFEREKGIKEGYDTAKKLIRHQSKLQKVQGIHLLSKALNKKHESADADVSIAMRAVCDDDPLMMDAGVGLFAALIKRAYCGYSEALIVGEILLAIPDTRYTAIGLKVLSLSLWGHYDAGLRYADYGDRFSKDEFSKELRAIWRIHEAVHAYAKDFAREFIAHENSQVRQAAAGLFESLPICPRWLKDEIKLAQAGNWANC